MDGVIRKGHAEKVPLEQLERDDGRVWYIPHHGVIHGRRPSVWFLIALPHTREHH